jgi:hypothetical protein
MDRSPRECRGERQSWPEEHAAGSGVQSTFLQIGEELDPSLRWDGGLFGGSLNKAALPQALFGLF